MPKTYITAALFLLSTLSLWSADWVTPRIEVKVVDAQSGRPAGDTKCALSTRRWFDLSYDLAAEKQCDAQGSTVFEPMAMEKFNRVALSFHWVNEGKPERAMFYIWKTKKGKKGPLGYKTTLRSGDGYYLLNDNMDGDCGNLFKWSQKGDVLTITFTRPKNYAACKETKVDYADFQNIGNRDINKGSLNLYSFKDDRQMGGGFFQEIKGTAENPLLEDPTTTAYIESMVKRIAKASDMPDLDYEVMVIDADVVNAFAVPGGYIAVYRGLIEATENEAELAGVIAHEIAHVTGRHGTEGMTSSMMKVGAAMAVSEIAKNELKDKQYLAGVVQNILGSGTQFWIMGGTRHREAEADFLGAQYAFRAGYDPRGIATLFNRWSQQRDKPLTRIDQFFSDHPNDDVRVANVMQQVDFFMPDVTGTQTTSREYEAVKKRLKGMPPPKVAGEAAGQALFNSFKASNEALFYGELQKYLGVPQDQP